MTEVTYFKKGNNLIKFDPTIGCYAYINHSNNGEWEYSWELTDSIQTGIPSSEPVPITLEQAKALHKKLTKRELVEDEEDSSGPRTPPKETDEPTKKPSGGRILDRTEEDAGKSFILIGVSHTPNSKPKGN